MGYPRSNGKGSAGGSRGAFDTTEFDLEHSGDHATGSGSNVPERLAMGTGSSGSIARKSRRLSRQWVRKGWRNHRYRSLKYAYSLEERVQHLESSLDWWHS
eukprot:6006547-Lingulodinium_polyedra.AAC.1